MTNSFHTLLTPSIIAKELMMLSEVRHGILFHRGDRIVGDFSFRWVADGRSVAFRLTYHDLALSLNDLSEKLREHLKTWKAAKPVADCEAEIARLKMELGRDAGWNEERFNG